jgi:hypothetical protein
MQTFYIAVYIQTPFAPGPKYNELILHRITLLAASIVACGGGWIMVGRA